MPCGGQVAEVVHEGRVVVWPAFEFGLYPFLVAKGDAILLGAAVRNVQDDFVLTGANCHAFPTKDIVLEIQFYWCENFVAVPVARSSGVGIVCEGNVLLVLGQSVVLAVVNQHFLYPFLYGDTLAVALCQCDDHVCLGDDIYELTICSVCLCPASLGALPHLVTVSAVYALRFHHFANPLPGDEAHTVPCAAVQKELSELCHSNDKEVTQSREKYGSNAIPDSEPTTFWAEFKETFSDPMIKILLAITALMIAMFFFGDCDGCCTQNAGELGFLIDIESYTCERLSGTKDGCDGVIEWTCLDCE